MFISQSFKYLKTISRVVTLKVGTLSVLPQKLTLAFYFSSCPHHPSTATPPQGVLTPVLPYYLYTLKSILLPSSLPGPHFFLVIYCIILRIHPYMPLRTSPCCLLRGCPPANLVLVSTSYLQIK